MNPLKKEMKARLCIFPNKIGVFYRIRKIDLVLHCIHSSLCKLIDDLK